MRGKARVTRKRYDKHALYGGWQHVTITGTPMERGKQHGRQLHVGLRRLFFVLPFLVEQTYNITIEAYYAMCRALVSKTVHDDFPELYEELTGISVGARERGMHCTVDQLIAWNAFLSMYELLHPKKSHQRCSAFIATGNATAHGDIVMSHNTHCDLASGSLYNVVMHVVPTSGFAFVMQTAPGMVCSGTDFFVSASGIIGCETTIAFAKYLPQFKGNYPYFCRIRQAMQYGTTLDAYADIMTTKNAGDYPCSWLFGDIRTREIMLCEVGLKEFNVQRTKNGIFFGMNSAMSKQLRSRETTDTTHTDVTKSTGARHRRLKTLLFKRYYGKITCAVAKQIIRDHYDEDKRVHRPSNLTVCNHAYTGGERPHAATDGKVVDSEMAKELRFWGLFGSSCGTPFSKKAYIQTNPKYKAWAPYLVDVPRHAWTVVGAVPR